MPNIHCDNEKCEHMGVPMWVTDEDSRQEWYEVTYQCRFCGKIKIHRTKFDQNGLMITDIIEDE